MIVIHELLLAAVHPHAAGLVTAIGVPAPPSGPIDWLLGAIEVGQEGTPGCVTATC
jgi:hypothetical protein